MSLSKRSKEPDPLTLMKTVAIVSHTYPVIDPEILQRAWDYICVVHLHALSTMYNIPECALVDDLYLLCQAKCMSRKHNVMASSD